MDNEFRFLLYKTEQEDISVDALIQYESIWLTQKAMQSFLTLTNQE